MSVHFLSTSSKPISAFHDHCPHELEEEEEKNHSARTQLSKCEIREASIAHPPVFCEQICSLSAAAANDDDERRKKKKNENSCHLERETCTKRKKEHIARQRR